MKRTLSTWELAGFGIVCLAGTLLHFLYDWSMGNRIAAAFAAVNESTWENMKLLYVPYFFYGAAEWLRFGRRLDNFLAAKAAGALAGLFAIPMLFYLLTGSFGSLPAAMHIGIFVLSAAIAFLVSSALCRSGAFRRGWQQLLGLVLLWGLLFLFVRCTYHPPRLPLFRDPLALYYGILR